MSFLNILLKKNLKESQIVHLYIKKILKKIAYLKNIIIEEILGDIINRYNLMLVTILSKNYYKIPCIMVVQL